jgi:threonine/homoserine/homoserine lactone efflux protein
MRATLQANAGYHVATWVVTLVIGLGFTDMIAREPQLFRIIKYFGCGYVFWLAIGFLRAGVSSGAPVPGPAGFRDGVILLILNPKAYVIIALMFSQFLAANESQIGAVLAITTIFTANNLVAFSLYTLAGDRLTRGARIPHNIRRLNIVFGLTLMGVALWMLSR